MRIAMIGGTGQLGHFVLKHLAKNGHELIAIGLGKEPEAGFLPAGTTLLLRNIDLCSQQELEDLFKGVDVVIHGAGADGRNLFDKPAIDGFRKANVEPIRTLIKAMKNAGGRKLVILGSYYTAMHRSFPSLDIPSKSPYVRSRVEQTSAAFEEAGSDISVGVLELPYIFGAAPNRPTLWGFYIDKLKEARDEVHVHAGGSACITMNQVGIATAHCCEVLEGHQSYPIGNENLKYSRIMEIFAEHLHLDRKIVASPSSYFMADAQKQADALELASKESAYDPVGLLAMEEQDFFIDPLPVMKTLSYDFEDIREAIGQSIAATVNKKGRGPGVIH